MEKSAKKEMSRVSASIILVGFLTAAAHAGQLTATSLGAWGTGPYLDVCVEGNHAFCAAGKAGMDIIDISDPTEPSRAASVWTYGSAVCVGGGYAYAAGSGLQVIDISDPASPQPRGMCGFPSGALG